HVLTLLAGVLAAEHSGRMTVVESAEGALRVYLMLVTWIIPDGDVRPSVVVGLVAVPFRENLSKPWIHKRRDYSPAMLTKQLLDLREVEQLGGAGDYWRWGGVHRWFGIGGEIEIFSHGLVCSPWFEGSCRGWRAPGTPWPELCRRRCLSSQHRRCVVAHVHRS